MKAKINEIFKSIQGEGIYQGVEQVFVRFFGCNLNCSFCDTKSGYYQEKSLGEVIEEIFAHKNYHSISLTGGEPLLQIGFLKELAKRLKSESRIVYLETNGVLYRYLEEIIDYTDIISMDFKLPSSTGQRSFWGEHRKFLELALKKDVFVKAVISKITDLKDLFKAIKLIEELKPGLPFILQPQNPYEEELKEKIAGFLKLAREHLPDVRSISQMHKALGVR